MHNHFHEFILQSRSKSFDKVHRNIINYNIDKYDNAVGKGLSRLSNLDSVKKKVHSIKWRAIENLDKYLIEFESNLIRNGGKVIWANNAAEANQAIIKIAKQHQVSSVVKSKSMITEEIELNNTFKENNINVLETDLGEFIVQLLGQKPYHIVTPAMHLSRQNIADLFHRQFGTAINATPQELTLKARELLRHQFVDAGIGITGANFLIADTGSVAITENEGNARLVTTFPKIHITIAGIEKIIPSMADLDIFWPLLSTHGTGQNLTVYNTLLTGPKQYDENDGPTEMYVILLDNGRTQLLKQKEQRQALYCIRCGACLNACPVYRNIGGHTYATTYSGPIGSVISPHLKGMKDFKHLSQASTLCGKCTEVCPVKIDLHKMLLLNRRDAAQYGNNSWLETVGWFFWKKAMLSRKVMDMLSPRVKRNIFQIFFKSIFKVRELPLFGTKSYSASKNSN